MEKRPRLILNIALSAVLLLMIAGSTAHIVFSGGSGNMQVAGTRAFMYFTVDSNILAGIACLISLIYNIRLLLGSIRRIPGWVCLLKYSGTAAVMLTFTVVIFFLGTIYGYGPMFYGSSLFLHGLNPVLAALIFILLDPWADIRGVKTLFAAVPTAVYAVFYVTLVVFVGPENGGWYDFYAFNSGILEGKWYLTAAVVLLVSYLLGLLLLRLQKASIGRDYRRISSGRND